MFQTEMMVKFSLLFIRQHATKIYDWVDTYLHAI